MYDSTLFVILADSISDLISIIFLIFVKINEIVIKIMINNSSETDFKNKELKKKFKNRSKSDAIIIQKNEVRNNDALNILMSLLYIWLISCAIIVSNSSLVKVSIALSEIVTL
jgi:hypothetical protein